MIAVPALKDVVKTAPTGPHLHGALHGSSMQQLRQATGVGGVDAIAVADAVADAVGVVANAAANAVAAAVDRLDRAERVALSADRDLRRVLADIDRADGALHLGGNGDRLAVGAGGI